MANHSIQIKIPFRQKIALIVFAIFLSLLILEIGLRLGGFIFLVLQERRNLYSIERKGNCLIMCLGESTTALGGEDSYPSQLEEVLNARNIGIKFSVINKGVPAIHTTAIVANLIDNLNRYKPNIVITMMGINDQIVYLQDQDMKSVSGKTMFLKQLRIYKLGQFILLHIKAKIKEINTYRKEKSGKGSVLLSNLFFGLRDCYAEQDNCIQKEISLKKSLKLNPRDYEAYISLGWLYENQEKFTLADEAFKKAIAIYPLSDDAYLGLGFCYSHQERFSEAEELWRRGLEINPRSCQLYLALGNCYNYQAKREQAEESFRKVLDINPKNEEAYLGLGWTYESQKKNDQAEEFFKKALELNPNNYSSCVDIGLLYSTKGKDAQAEVLLKRALELNPGDERVCVNLGWCYKRQKRYAEAEEAFKKVLETNPKNDKASGGLAELYEEMGKFESAKEYRQKADVARIKYYNHTVSISYLKLKEILDQRGVKYVCVQYPNRSVEPLKKIFEGQKNVVFVDNEGVFREAIKKDGFEEYFSDAFAGDFGHCTRKGNRILAENIANIISKEILHK